VLVGLAVLTATTNMIDSAWSEVLMPAWILDQGLGSDMLGTLFAVFSLAAVAGSALASIYASRLPRVPVFLIGYLLAGAPRYAAMAAGLPLPWVMGVFVVSGFGAGFINPVLGAVTFEHVPDILRGRVISLFNALAWSLMPFGALLGGLLTQHAGLAPTLAGLGAAYLVVTVLPVIIPAWRDFGRPTPAPAPGDVHPATEAPQDGEPAGAGTARTEPPLTPRGA